MRDRNAPACFSTPILLASGRSPLEPAKVLEFLDKLDVKLVPWQQDLILTIMCGPLHGPWPVRKTTNDYV